MKIKGIYINPKNVCVIGTYIDKNSYGLIINGVKLEVGNYKDFEDISPSVLKELDIYMQQIINEIEKG